MNTHVTPLLASRGFVDFHSSGPCRVRASRKEFFIYQFVADPEALFERLIDASRVAVN